MSKPSNKVRFSVDTKDNQKSQWRPNIRRIARRGRNDNTQPPISQQHTLTTTKSTKKAVDIDDIPNSLEFPRMNNNNNAAISRKRTHSTMMIGNDIIRSTKMNNAKRMNLGLKLLPSGSITGTTNVSVRGGEEQQSNIGNYQQQEQEQQVDGGDLEDVLLKSIPEDKETNKGIEEGDDNTIEIDATAVQKEDQESSSKPAAAATKRTVARSIGNVKELFDDDIEEVLDLTELDDAATAVGNKSIESKTADKKASAGMPKDDNEGDETTTASFVGIDDMIVDDDDDDDDDSEDGDNDNELFTQPPEYGEARGLSRSPKALKRGPKARPKKNQIDEQQIVESQVPFPLTRKAASEKSPRRKHSLDNDDEEEEDVDFGPQSQSEPSKPNHNEEEDGTYQESQQMPIPAKKKKSPLPTKKSKRWRKNRQEEEIVPRSLRKQPPELLGQMNVFGDDRRQSQIPLPTRKRVSNERQVVAEEEEDRRQSRIPPLPTRKRKTHGRFSLQSNHYKSLKQHTKYSKSEEDEDDDADGRIEMSLVPINTKKQSTRCKSPLKPKPKVDDYSSDASSDGWMQIRRTAKPKIKSKKSRSSLQSNHFYRKFDDSLERVGKMKSNSSRTKAQPPAKRTKYEDSDDDSDDERSQSQMAAGEGSGESTPLRKRLCDQQNSGDKEESGSKNDSAVRKSIVASKAKATLGLGTSPISSVARVKQSNDDESSLEGFKIVKNKKRKSKFDMSNFLLKNAKKFAWIDFRMSASATSSLVADNSDKKEQSQLTEEMNEEINQAEAEKLEKEQLYRNRRRRRKKSEKRNNEKVNNEQLPRRKKKSTRTRDDTIEDREIMRHQKSLENKEVEVWEVRCLREAREPKNKEKEECGATTVAVCKINVKGDRSFRATCPCFENCKGNKRHSEWKEVKRLKTKRAIEQAWKKRMRLYREGRNC